MNYEEYLNQMGTNTTGRYDVTPLFADSRTFESLRTDLLAGVNGSPTAVVGIDALGLALGSALATELNIGLVVVRKGGKLPYSDDELLQREITDYSGTAKSLELHPDMLDTQDRTLLIDDWVETGAQMRATANLVETAGASITGIMAIRIHHTEGTKPLFEQYDVYSLEDRLASETSDNQLNSESSE